MFNYLKTYIRPLFYGLAPEGKHVGRPQGAAELGAKAAQLAAEAMRYRWQAQRLRSGV